MDDYPYWDELSLADQLWIVALEVEGAGLQRQLPAPIRKVAEVLETLAPGDSRPDLSAVIKGDQTTHRAASGSAFSRVGADGQAR